MDMVKHYETEADEMSALEALREIRNEPLAKMDELAVIAFGHMVDGTATLEDLQNYRAWIVYHRMQGLTDDEMGSAIAVAADMARKLGVA